MFNQLLAPLAETLQKVKILPQIGNDRILLTPNPAGTFNTKSAYKALLPAQEKVQWYQLVWNNKVIPRHKITTWMLLTGALPT
ncbi:hypothetical protein FRX31_034944 [Thalictrum thalictroides]|uniref:Reverse transcriptase zinc-binding domain-containing protein n=1 Tax=Thalictrum thalictroides TaxID=46969 RepID=A0A7J6USK6_THATH|nr:hypothetical protein FRX31_034944 [Thalictrum thalictroides]